LASGLLKIKRDALFIFPLCATKWKEEKTKVMRLLRQLLFTIAVTVGLAISASAQNSNQQPQKPPPKPEAPKVRVPPDKGKPPPKEDKPKKPGMAFVEQKRYLDDTV
jgi:hypothetical protein